MHARNAIVTGGMSGLGLAIAHVLRSTHKVWVPDIAPETSKALGGIITDVSDRKSVEILPSIIKDNVDVLVNCAGINEINFLEDLDEDAWDKIIGVNAKGIYLMTKTFLPQLKPGAIVINIVSNASHMPMTSSLAYNASKGAAHIMTRQMARELFPRHGITVIGISPNKLAGTGMSKYIDERVCATRGWTPEEAKAYQIKSLPAGQETSAEACAEFICNLVTHPEHRKFLNGCVMPYGA